MLPATADQQTPQHDEARRLAEAEARIARAEARVASAGDQLAELAVDRAIVRAARDFGAGDPEVVSRLVDRGGLRAGDPRLSRHAEAAVADLARRHPTLLAAPGGGGSPQAIRRPSAPDPSDLGPAVDPMVEIRKAVRYPM